MFLKIFINFNHTTINTFFTMHTHSQYQPYIIYEKYQTQQLKKKKTS